MEIDGQLQSRPLRLAFIPWRTNLNFQHHGLRQMQYGVRCGGGLAPSPHTVAFRYLAENFHLFDGSAVCCGQAVLRLHMAFLLLAAAKRPRPSGEVPLPVFEVRLLMMSGWGISSWTDFESGEGSAQ